MLSKLNRTYQGFTQIELLTVMVIIAILAGLAAAIIPFAIHHSAVSRAKGEIGTLTLKCEAYKADNGEYPRTDATDTLDPRIDGIPTGIKGEPYRKSSKDLYSRLSKSYYEFPVNMLNVDKDASGKAVKVNYIQDPWGNPFGYSTAMNADESRYAKDILKNPNAPRPQPARGYNKTFDLWSIGGASAKGAGAGNPDPSKWIKSW
jgi:prepilin-type N-terminal cleavage/methylation domain-containing protein